MRLFGLVVIGVFFGFLASTGEAATINVNCSTGGVLQTAIDGAASGDTISVNGICNENVDVDKSVVIDGKQLGIPTAEIHGPDTAQPTVKIRAGSVTIKNFHSIQGGQDGIYVSVCGPTILNNTVQNTGRDGILVFAGTNPTINGNTIQTNTRYGIDLYANSFATIINNTITSNTSDGIAITETSAARIGFSSGSDTVASPNTITNNGGRGIYVYSSSNARIVGNTISGNAGEGVRVAKLSHADIANNTIDNNQQHGIFVREDSGVNLGNGSGTTIFDLPNDTTVNNLKWGISYSTGAYVAGRLGTLNGDNGASDCSGIGITISSLSDIADDFGIDVVTASNGLIRLGNALGNNTTKTVGMVLRHYNNGEEPVILFGGTSTSAINSLAFGGGSASGNAATQLDFYTAPNPTTPVGTSRMTIASNGNIGIGTTAPSRNLDVSGGVPIMQNAGTAGFDFKNTGATFGSSISVGTAGNPNLYGNWSAATNAKDDVTKVAWALRLDIGGDRFRVVRVPVGGSPADVFDVNGNGSITSSTGAFLSAGGAWTDASSREYKENIKELTSEEAINTLAGLNPIKYNYKTDKDERHLGFIAEDVPDLVAVKDRKGLSPMDIVAVLTKVVQELKARNEMLEERLLTLESKDKTGK